MALALALLLAPDWIADLDHDDPAVREAATAALRELGDCAETNLRSRLKAGVPAEAAARIRDLLAGIELRRRVAAFPGGEEVDGLRCAVSLGGSAGDARREVRLEILNAGSSVRAIPAVRSWGGRMPGRSWSSSADRAILRVTGGPDVRRKTFLSSRSCGGAREADPVALRPGESRSFSSPLDTTRLLPGRYRLGVAYLGPDSVDVPSNAVDFDVAPPPPTVR